MSGARLALWAARTLAAALVLAAIAYGARAPYHPPGSDAALLRLSWRFRPDARENCRPRTPAELDALPVHMRTPEVCEREHADYHLIRRIGDGKPDTISVLPGGLRHDRPVYVLLDSSLSAGTYRVQVALTRSIDGAAAGPVLVPLDTVLELRAGSVALVTTDASNRLMVATASPRAASAAPR